MGFWGGGRVPEGRGGQRWDTCPGDQAAAFETRVPTSPAHPSMRGPGCQDAGMPGCRDDGMPGCKDAGMQGYRNARMPDITHSLILVCVWCAPLT